MLKKAIYFLTNMPVKKSQPTGEWKEITVTFIALALTFGLGFVSAKREQAEFKVNVVCDDITLQYTTVSRELTLDC